MTAHPPRIAVLTSGGDAPGMNAAVRAAVRAGIERGAHVFGILEGWQGAVDGGRGIRRLGWDDVAGILHRGGTVLGTARCLAFRERAGMRQAAFHLVQHRIDRVVVIGGDGSLAGAAELAQLWPELLTELVASGDLEQEQADAHPRLVVCGLVGSIDNDMVGTDMTIGADSALHRIVDALDAISSTAASHRRTFVVEVMGRRCGYLALASALAGASAAAFIPEDPPAADWGALLGESQRLRHELGGRDSTVVVAEGARERDGRPITVESVRQVLERSLGADARSTTLGHVQRGGTPSAYDRSMASTMGATAVDVLLSGETEPQVIGVRHNRAHRSPLLPAVRRNRDVARLVDEGRYAEAMAARGSSFTELDALLRTIRSPHPTPARATQPRVAVLHVGGLAPGMNAAVRAAVRLGSAEGLAFVGVEGGLRGLLDGSVRPLTPADVESWVADAGAALGSRRDPFDATTLPRLAEAVTAHGIDGLLLVGRAEVRRHWRLLFAAGLVCAALGILTVIDSLDGALHVPDRWFGVLLLIESLGSLVLATTVTGTARRLRLLKGALLLAMAVLIVASTRHSTFLLAMIFGTAFLVDGTVRIVIAGLLKFSGWRVSVALGALGVLRVASGGGRMGRALLHPLDPWAQDRAPDDLAFTVDHFLASCCACTNLSRRKRAARRVRLAAPSTCTPRP